MIWLDDRHGAGLHSGPTLPFDPSDRGLTLGDGLFDTLTVFAGRPFRLQPHLDRLRQGLTAIGLAIDPARIDRAIEAMLATVAGRDAILRTTVTRGGGARGVALPAQPMPTVMAAVADWSPALVFQPQHLASVSIARNERSPLSRLKTLSYLEAILGLEEARRAGAGDALFANTTGRIAASSMANVFAVFPDRIITPPVSDGVLPGIIRAELLSMGALAGRPVIEASLMPEDLSQVSEMFLTNSVRLVTPVSRLDSRDLPGTRGPAARAALGLLADAIRAQTGSDLSGHFVLD